MAPLLRRQMQTSADATFAATHLSSFRLGDGIGSNFRTRAIPVTPMKPSSGPETRSKLGHTFRPGVLHSNARSGRGLGSSWLCLRDRLAHIHDASPLCASHWGDWRLTLTARSTLTQKWFHRGFACRLDELFWTGPSSCIPRMCIGPKIWTSTMQSRDQ